jgi:dienelactone hydrolase
MTNETVPPRHTNWFAYFPEDYRWSAATALLLSAAGQGGAEMAEVDRVGRQLRERPGDDRAWFQAWVAEADRLGQLAERARRAGQHLTAAAFYLRACAYAQIGERFRTPKDEVALAVYRAAVDRFRRYAELTDAPRIECVEVPYQDTSLPAYLIHAENTAAARPPCVVYFDGLDVTKELCYLRGAREIARRGMACLVVDGPGTGEAIRFRGLPLRHDYERAGSACLDYLGERGDVDVGRTGVLALSLGGYYASRVAAMEPRYRACVAWGAIWDYHSTWERRLASGFRTQLSVPAHHIQWILGVDRTDAALRELERFRLDGVAQRIRCPFLLVHGEQDEQVPLADAESLFRAVGSEDKTLRVFTADEGGAQHCQHDYLSVAATTIADWLAERLGAERHGGVVWAD